MRVSEIRVKRIRANQGLGVFGDTVFWLASLHLWGNARNCGRQLSAQDLLLWVSRTLVQFRTNKTKSNLIENIIILIF